MSATDLGKVIDTWMRAQDRWVPTAEIEERFQVNERRLRFDGARPGLLSLNCISNGRGYKHVRVATEAEFTQADRHDRKPLATRFFVLRKRRQRRREERTFIPVPMEVKTGQCLLFK